MVTSATNYDIETAIQMAQSLQSLEANFTDEFVHYLVTFQPDTVNGLLIGWGTDLFRHPQLTPEAIPVFEETFNVVMRSFLPAVDTYTTLTVFDQTLLIGKPSLIQTVVDNIDPATFTEISQIAPFIIGDGLYSIANSVFFSPYELGVTIEEAVEVAADYVSKLGAFISGDALGQAISAFNAQGSIDGMLAIIENVDPAQLQDIPQYALSDALFGITNVMNHHANVDVTPAEAADAAARLVQLVGQYIDPFALGAGMADFARDANLDGILAIAENVDPAQFQNIPPFFLGDALYGIVNSPNFYFNGLEVSPAEAAEVAAQYVSLVGNYIEADALGNAIADFARDYNVDGVLAIAENIDPAQIADIANSHGFFGSPFDNGLQAITYISQNIEFDPETGMPDPQSDEAVDYAARLVEAAGDAISLNGLENGLRSFSQTQNVEGVDAIISNLSADKLSQLQDTGYFEFVASEIQIGTDTNDFLWLTDPQQPPYGSVHTLDGNDVVITTQNGQHVFGNDGNDTLVGWGYDNTLYGGDGSDVLYSGVGTTLVFNEGDAGVDTVYRFDGNNGSKLDISDYLEGFNPYQDAIDDFVSLEFDGVSTTTLSVDADGQGGEEAVVVAELIHATSVTLDDVVTTDNPFFI